MENSDVQKRLERIENKLDLVLRMRAEFELMKKLFAAAWLGLITWVGLKK